MLLCLLRLVKRDSQLYFLILNVSLVSACFACFDNSIVLLHVLCRYTEFVSEAVLEPLC